MNIWINGVYMSYFLIAIAVFVFLFVVTIVVPILLEASKLGNARPGPKGMESVEARILAERRKREQELGKKKALKEELEREMALPKYRVAFSIAGTRKKYGKAISPVESYRIFTSNEMALMQLKSDYKNGFFEDESGITYPTSVITKAWVEEVK